MPRSEVDDAQVADIGGEFLRFRLVAAVVAAYDAVDPSVTDSVTKDLELRCIRTQVLSEAVAFSQVEVSAGRDWLECHLPSSPPSDQEQDTELAVPADGGTEVVTVAMDVLQNDLELGQ